MKRLDINEIKQIELDILVNIAKFCDEYGLRYYLAGGTLLGAIRHKGFIPWDDDIDIIMPREDYIKFFKTYKSDCGFYKADSILNNADYWLQTGKVFDLRTIVINNNEKYQSNIWIDVFPTDGVPKNIFLRYVHFLHIKIANYIYLSTVTTYSKSHHFVDKLEKMSGFKQKLRTYGKYTLIVLFGSWLKPSKILKYIDKQVSKYPLNTSNKIASQVACQYFMKEIVDGQNFIDRIAVYFEGHRFWAPKGYDEYLSNLYGENYMKLPPVDKQVSRHKFKAYWKEENKI